MSEFNETKIDHSTHRSIATTTDDVTSSYPPPPIYERDAVQELIARPATPPAFPDDLPGRKDNKIRVARSWIIGAGLITFLLFTATVILAILLAIAKQPPAQSSLIPLPDSNPETPLATTTAYVTSISTIIRNITATSTDTFTWTHDNFVTITLTTIATVSATPTSPVVNRAECTPTSPALYIAPSFCIMVSSCNETSSDIQSNDCLNFCRAGTGGELCAKSQAARTERENDCCGHCGCDS